MKGRCAGAWPLSGKASRDTIACDLASASKIVAPVHQKGAIFGVLDTDSPVPARFDAQDEEGLPVFVKAMEVLLNVTQ